jgi:hypothetical protein
LAFKKKCPATINKISKLSKTHHKPLVSNALNEVTQRQLEYSDMHWLDNATPFALFKAMTAVYTRMQGQTAFNYRIRNGKSWYKKQNTPPFLMMSQNFNILSNYVSKRWNFSNHTVYIPKKVEYAVPTSEKMFVGNIPTGTKFYGKKLAVGIYWKDAWGARDLDLSATAISGQKIGWNAGYSNSALTYSGDITSAPNGAVEYLHCQNLINDPYIVRNNIYSGSDTSKYKIIVGKGSKITKKYMMNPNNLLAEIQTEAIQKQMVLGLFLPERDKSQSFVLLNFGAGHVRVSGLGGLPVTALYEQYRYPFHFGLLFEMLGAKTVESPEEATLDFSLDKLDKDTFIKLFNK